MAYNASMSDRLTIFKQNFSRMMESGGKLVGRRNTGYDELSQGLMENEYRQDGNPVGSLRERYQGPLPGISTESTSITAAPPNEAHVPSQVTPPFER